MKTFNKIVLSTLAVCSVGVFGFVTTDVLAEQKTAQLQLTINPGTVTIGIGEDSGTVTLTLTSKDASFTSQDTEWTFTDAFWVQDLKGAAAGYTTTLQSSDLVWQTLTSNTIAASNVKLTVNGVTKTAGESNSAVQASASSSALNSAVTFIHRGNSTAWILWKYEALPTITVTIPANTPADTYKGTLTYTITENS